MKSVKDRGVSRRDFLIGAANLTVASMAKAAATRLRLGGPIFLESEDPRELAREHRRLGYRAAYVPKLSSNERERIEATIEAFAAEDVIIAEVGAWKNLMDPDENVRRQNLEYVIDRMTLAEQVGALNCVTISGSMNAQHWDGPDQRNDSREFFEATVENSRKILDSVKPKRAKFTLEMILWSPPENSDEYLRLIRAVDRPAFGAHIDICNIINSPQEFYNNGDITRSTFKKLGKWIVSCHAKDLWGHGGHFAETIPGRGGLDYAAYLNSIRTYAPNAPLMLEHLTTAEQYEEGRQYIMRVAQQNGISFG